MWHQRKLNMYENNYNIEKEFEKKWIFKILIKN